MERGIRGTYVIAWKATEIDGQRAAPVEALAPGAGWRWYGRALRIEGPQDVLLLGAGEEALALRARAGRRVPRLAGVPAPAPLPAPPMPALSLREGFTVSDGQRSYPVAILRDAAGGPLLAFSGALPPQDRELWITRLARPARLGQQAGPQGVVCFAQGTRLRTPRGEVPVEELEPGDRVMTCDDGAQEVLWIGGSHLDAARLQLQPGLRPIRLSVATSGTGAPDGELLVSPRHRLLLCGAEARALFGSDEVLVAAGDLLDGQAVTRVPAGPGVTYYHLLFARHQLVWANGVPSESFHPAETPLARVPSAQLKALLGLMPELARDPHAYGAPARRMLTRGEAAILTWEMRRRSFGRASHPLTRAVRPV